MDNEILEELWKTRRKIEGKEQQKLKNVFRKFKKNQRNNPSKYYSGKPRRIKEQKV